MNTARKNTKKKEKKKAFNRIKVHRRRGRYAASGCREISYGFKRSLQLIEYSIDFFFASLHFTFRSNAHMHRQPPCKYFPWIMFPSPHPEDKTWPPVYRGCCHCIQQKQQSTWNRVWLQVELCVQCSRQHYMGRKYEWVLLSFTTLHTFIKNKCLIYYPCKWKFCIVSWDFSKIWKYCTKQQEWVRGQGAFWTIDVLDLLDLSRSIIRTGYCTPNLTWWWFFSFH